MKTFEERLQLASASWVRDGLIDDAQRAAILARHPARASGSRFMVIAATIGGLLVAVGVSLVIKSNWEAIGDWTKIGGVVVLLVAAYAAGWKLTTDGRHFAKTGDACLMVGQLIFLGGVALVSQTFHLNARPATYVLFWWLGIAAVPWLTRAKGAQFVSIVAGLVWFGMEITTPGSWIEVTARSHGHGHDPVAVQAVMVLLGVSLWGFGLALRNKRWAEFAGVHEKWGLIVTSGALFLLGFARHHWEWRQPAESPTSAGNAGPLAIAGALAVASFVAARRSRRTEAISLAPWCAVSCAIAACAAIVGPLGDDGWLWSALAWLSLLVLSIATIRVGLEAAREGWVNLGILFVAADIVARYFDLFGSMLEGGVFFIVSGVLVGGVGIYLEKRRRALVASLRKEVAS